jgi:hypothetical protein
VRDELAGWLGSFDRYGGEGADRGFYLECWNGAPYVCDRVKFNAVPLRIEHASLSIIGGMVPDRLRDALAEADDGLPAYQSRRWLSAALRMQRIDVTCLKKPRVGYAGSKWALTITVRQSRSCYASTVMPLLCSTNSGRKQCSERALQLAWPVGGMEKILAAYCGSHLFLSASLGRRMTNRGASQ